MPSALLLLGLATTGCHSARAKYATAGASAIAGVLVLNHHADGECTSSSGSPGTGTSVCNALIADPVNDMVNATTTVLGVGLLVLATGLVISAADQPRGREERLIPIASTPPPPAPAIAYASAGAPAIAYPPAAAPATSPASVAITSRIENRLAIQASMAARAGHCSSAVITANRLAELDADLHITLLANDTELALCYATSGPAGNY